MAFPSAACHHAPQLCQLKGPEPTPLHSVHWASLCCLHCRWRETSANLTIIAQSKLGTIHITSCISPTGRVSCSPGLWRWPCLQRIQHFTKQMASYGLTEFRARMWSSKVSVKILPQSELETTSSVFRNWKNWTIGGWGLVLLQSGGCCGGISNGYQDKMLLFSYIKNKINSMLLFC